MKTIELKRIGECKGTYVVSNGETFGCIDKCDIPDDEIVVIGKKDYRRLERRNRPYHNLPQGAMVMVLREGENWIMGKYEEDGIVNVRSGGLNCGMHGWDHIIPFSLFDPNDPDKWNGTRNDYGTGGDA